MFTAFFKKTRGGIVPFQSSSNCVDLSKKRFVLTGITMFNINTLQEKIQNG